MGKKIRSFCFLSKIFESIPTDVIYYISKYCGKYIHLPKVETQVYKTKTRDNKYYTKHLVTKNRQRSISI